MDGRAKAFILFSCLFICMFRHERSQNIVFRIENSIQRNGKWNYWKLNWISVFCFENCLTSLQVSHSFHCSSLCVSCWRWMLCLGYCCNLYFPPFFLLVSFRSIFLSCLCMLFVRFRFVLRFYFQYQIKLNALASMKHFAENCNNTHRLTV